MLNDGLPRRVWEGLLSAAEILHTYVLCATIAGDGRHKGVGDKMECSNMDGNMDLCSCSYPGCPRKGKCCECLQYHLGSNQLPACAFPADVEKTYDRSFARFARIYK